MLNMQNLTGHCNKQDVISYYNNTFKMWKYTFFHNTPKHLIVNNSPIRSFIHSFIRVIFKIKMS